MQGTGSVGSHILESLLAYNKHTITVLSRTTSTETFPTGVAVKKVDYTSDDSIASALRGQDFLVITLSATAPPDTHPRIINAAAAAGVKYILPNHFGYALKDDRPSKLPIDSPELRALCRRRARRIFSRRRFCYNRMRLLVRMELGHGTGVLRLRHCEPESHVLR
jgi:hypothetical protein